MLVRGTGIDAQMPHDAPAERAARHHALDGLLDHALGMLSGEDRALAALFDAAGETRVPVEHAGLALVAGQRDLLGVDDDDVIAAIHVRCIGPLVLAAEPVGDQRGKPAEHEPVGVDQQPLFLDRGRGGVVSLHPCSSGKAGEYAVQRAEVKG